MLPLFSVWPRLGILHNNFIFLPAVSLFTTLIFCMEEYSVYYTGTVHAVNNVVDTVQIPLVTLQDPCSRQFLSIRIERSCFSMIK